MGARQRSAAAKETARNRIIWIQKLAPARAAINAARAPAQNQMEARPTVTASMTPKRISATSQMTLMGMDGIVTFLSVERLGCSPCSGERRSVGRAPGLVLS